MQTWPELNIPPQAAALAARSRSASARTIIGSLPPSSRLTGVSVSAARAITLRPVRSEPVNWMKSTASTRAPPVSPMPCTQSKHVGAADLLLPGLDHLGEAERGELGGLDDDGRAGLQRRDRVAEREDQREVPGADDADHRVGPVLDAQLLRGQQRRVRADRLLADELGRLGAVEVDQVGEVDRLARGVGADLAGLAPASCRAPARGCRAASRAACRASGSGPRSPSPPTRPGWRAPGRRSRRPPRAGRPRRWRSRSPVAGLRTSIRSARRAAGAVRRRRRLGARLGGAALHWGSLRRPFGWSAKL